MTVHIINYLMVNFKHAQKRALSKHVLMRIAA